LTTDPNKRIALNTVVTYTRSVIAAGLALFSSRWVLNSLGKTDYGLFSIVGCIVVFITFLNGVMSESTSRYFAFTLGQGDSSDVKRWFNAALSIHVCLAIALILIGWPVGEYVIYHFLTIPENRVTTCLWVFRISLVSAFLNMLSVPFMAMFTAKQQFSELAVWSLCGCTLTFTLAWSLRFVSIDRLLFYGIGMAMIIFFVNTALIIRAVQVFTECSFDSRLWFDRKRLGNIFTYGIWNLIGSAGALFRDQGSAILLNIFFGPSVNAAYGIATQVSYQTNQLSVAMIGAFSPEVTESEGGGNRTRMLLLSLRASKIGTILVLLFAIPLISEMDYVLKLWLVEPPLFTALFCQLILGAFVIDRLSTGYLLAVQAHGKIAAFQATLGTCLLLTLPLAWLLFSVGFAPTSIGIAIIATSIVTSIGRVLWVKALFGVPVQRWLISVVWPCAVVAIAASIAAISFKLKMQPSFLRVVLSTTASFLVFIFTTWFFAIDFKEREFVLNILQRVRSKIAI
jgi:O-antigen/teichoic acid export membrane protein